MMAATWRHRGYEVQRRIDEDGGSLRRRGLEGITVGLLGDSWLCCVAVVEELGIDGLQTATSSLAGLGDGKNWEARRLVEFGLGDADVDLGFGEGGAAQDGGESHDCGELNGDWIIMVWFWDLARGEQRVC
ncbi:hypothetical protein M0R45_026170 [Rubus argutus]|uniref:Uncharacterized protein n=1 Tax=Rubus argutus TaxID=59490 RepID=A0AAW1WW87_RUBAR